MCYNIIGRSVCKRSRCFPAATGVKLHADQGVLPNDASATVSAVTSSADFDTAKSNLSNFKVYSVSVSSDLNGKMRVSLPIPSGVSEPVVSQGISQPMTDSATYPTALIEVNPNGNTYATVRLSLMDNIENVSFKVQADGNAPFNDVDYDIMQENLDDNTTDFRMQIPSENSYLRATFYVVPMSRDVVYYIGFSDLQPGSADFVTSVEVLAPTEQPQTEAPTDAAVTSESTTTTETNTTAATDKAETTTKKAEKETETTTVAVTPNDEGYMPQTGGRSDADGLGVLIYDERGNKMNRSYQLSRTDRSPYRKTSGRQQSQGADAS